MSMYGANPEQLATLGRTLTNQIEAINQLMSTVDGVLNGTAWTGPGARPLRSGLERLVQAGPQPSQRGVRGGRARLRGPLGRAPPGDGCVTARTARRGRCPLGARAVR